MNDDEAIAQNKRSYRRLWWMALIMIIPAAAMGIGFGWAKDHGFLPPLLANNPLLAMTLGAIVLVGLVALWGWRVLAPLNQPRRIQRKMTEDRQRRSRISTIYNATVLLPMAALAVFSQRSGHSSGTDLDGWLIPGLFVLMCCVALLSIGGAQRIASSDDVARDLWRRATQLGFMLSVPGMGLIYLLSLYRPGWVPLAVPFLIAVTVAVPLFTFLILDWRAGRED